MEILVRAFKTSNPVRLLQCYSEVSTKECQRNESKKKIYLQRKKRKAWNRGKRTQMLVTVTEGLRVKAVGCFCSGAPSS